MRPPSRLTSRELLIEVFSRFIHGGRHVGSGVKGSTRCPQRLNMNGVNPAKIGTEVNRQVLLIIFRKLSEYEKGGESLRINYFLCAGIAMAF